MIYWFYGSPFKGYIQVYEGGWKNNLQQGQGEHSFASGHYDVAMWDQVRTLQF